MAPLDNNAPTPPPPKHTTNPYIRHGDGSWRLLPIALGALAVAVVAFMILSDQVTDREPPNAPNVESGAK
jgi:hypothetical protein